MNKVVIAVLATLVVVGAWWLVIQPHEDTKTATLYYYNPAQDQGPGGVQCSEAGLVGVEREVAANAGVEDVIILLLEGSLTSAEHAQGAETEFPLEGLELVNVVQEDEVLALTFADPQNKTSGGSCRVAILWHQIERTAREFSGADEIRFMPEELFQP